MDPVATLDELRRWIEKSLDAPAPQKAELMALVGDVVDRQRALSQASKAEALEAVQTAFADRMAVVRDELERRDTTMTNITRFFEEVVKDLAERARRDPKTKLLNFEWFMARIESFLAVEQRIRWSALGVVDLNGFKWVNDNLGHAIGDRVIARVAHILADRLRSCDLLTGDGAMARHGMRDLHARFGGDEFSFFIPDLTRPEDAPSRIPGSASTRGCAITRFSWTSAWCASSWACWPTGADSPARSASRWCSGPIS
jgi:GGDEF domain-containing protein